MPRDILTKVGARLGPGMCIPCWVRVARVTAGAEASAGARLTPWTEDGRRGALDLGSPVPGANLAQAGSRRTAAGNTRTGHRSSRLFWSSSTTPTATVRASGNFGSGRGDDERLPCASSPGAWAASWSRDRPGEPQPQRLHGWTPPLPPPARRAEELLRIYREAMRLEQEFFGAQLRYGPASVPVP